VINGKTCRLLYSAWMLRTPFPIGSKPEGVAPGAIPDTSEVGAHSAHHRRGRPVVTRKSVQGPALGTPYLLFAGTPTPGTCHLTLVTGKGVQRLVCLPRVPI
jgi:hypothetical protein